MTINVQRRKSVMARSMKLGHCVCNPRNPCPCDTFRRHNVCPCAGEKMPVKTGPIPLTRCVRKAGCASKIGQADLHRILGGLPQPADPNVLLGMAAGDDAGIYRIADGVFLVQTVDVFTPCVDDPHLFGRIAAANSVSDVYAMGGSPRTALSIVGFPIDDLDGDILQAILQGGIETLDAAECSLIGGHSINDAEIKCGFAVTGVIEGHAPIVRAAARPGDVLVLTKPLGTGMISFAAQIGRVSKACLAEAGESMATLNKDAAELMTRFGAHACTDVTGFGLAGHLVEMARGSGVDAILDLSRLPVFAAVARCIDQDILSGAIERNQEYAMGWVTVGENAELNPVLERNLSILYDPQTSGGLLVSLPEPAATDYVQALRDRGHAAASIIGRIIEKSPGAEEGRVVIGDLRLASFHGMNDSVLPDATGRHPNGMGGQTHADRETDLKETIMSDAKDFMPPDPDEPCCLEHSPLAGVPREAMPDVSAAPGVSDAASLDAALAPFMAFMKAANAPGRIDCRAKKLMAVALSIAHKCEPCLRSHLKSALAMGITPEELDEAAALAVAFGGCTAMMFYKGIRQREGL